MTNEIKRLCDITIYARNAFSGRDFSLEPEKYIASETFFWDGKRLVLRRNGFANVKIAD